MFAGWRIDPVHQSSIGIARLTLDDTEVTLIRRADEASYAAKQRGKNCVVLAESAA